MSRKRKNPDGSLKQPKPEKGLRRGIVKWAPPHIEGEDQASHDKHVNWMQQQRKRTKDIPWSHEKWTLHIPLEGNT